MLRRTDTRPPTTITYAPHRLHSTDSLTPHNHAQNSLPSTFATINRNTITRTSSKYWIISTTNTTRRSLLVWNSVSHTGPRPDLPTSHYTQHSIHVSYSSSPKTKRFTPLPHIHSGGNLTVLATTCDTLSGSLSPLIIPNYILHFTICVRFSFFYLCRSSTNQGPYST